MKVFQILNGICHWDATCAHPTLADTLGKYAPDIVFAEAPDHVRAGWGYADGEFIQPAPPEGWGYDVETGTFYPLDGTVVPGGETNNEKEENEMAVTYATLIVNGKRTFADVPLLLKEKVRQVLIDIDCAELATDE